MKQNWGKLEEEKNLNFFSIEIIIFVVFFRFPNIVCLDRIQKSLISQEKIAKFELTHQKKVLDECSSTLDKICDFIYFCQLILHLVL